MNIVFLDFDGVIATPDTCIAFDCYGWVIDPTKALMVARLCEETNSKIVVSSTWRINHTFFTMHDLLGAYGLAKYLLSKHKDNKTEMWRTPRKLTSNRGQDIGLWLADAKEMDLDITNYVILDDDWDFSPEQVKNHLVETSAVHGFCTEDYYKAIDILALVG